MSYPTSAADRSRWILARRGAKARLDAHRAYATAWEEEPDAHARLQPTAVVFLTNKECPFRCAMCDLWVNTLDTGVARGAIAAQIRSALASLPPATTIKLYNAGSFFDPDAIPPDDDEEIARELAFFDRVIVEAHPAFLSGVHGERCLRFRDRLRGTLEVAIGLETAHPAALAALNKGMTVDSFTRAAGFLAEHAIALRAFVLLNPPFIPGDEVIPWVCRSIDLAIDCGAAACSVIPTRGGNGAMEALGAAVTLARLTALESAIEYGIGRGRCRVFADLWDIERLFDCECAPRRAARLREMNRRQRVLPGVPCHCDAGRLKAAPTYRG